MILDRKEEKLREKKLGGLLADTKRHSLCLNFIMDKLQQTKPWPSFQHLDLVICMLSIFVLSSKTA
jgi:hypothetical protein